MSTFETAQRVLQYLSDKDMDNVLAMFDERGILQDPHYPYSKMRGKSQIEKGLKWCFSTLREMNFENINTITSANSNTVAVETHCKHKLGTGKQLDFQQVFVFEFSGNFISRVSAYTPFPPDGLMGIGLKLNHVFYRWFNNA